MALLAAGKVVLVAFPFSDLSQSKLRPAVVLADADRGDWILCQVTSRPYGDPRAISLTNNNFTVGSLRVESFVRPGKLFTGSSTLVLQEVGQLTAKLRKESSRRSSRYSGLQRNKLQRKSLYLKSARRQLQMLNAN